jgi:hypothetical protein
MLFPKSRRNQLATVPACAPCNNSFSRDEQYFQAVLLLGPCGTTRHGEAVWRESLARAYAKQIGLRKRIAGSTRYSNHYSPAGLLLGLEERVHFDQNRFNNVIIKIARGLYYLEYGEPIANHARFVARRIHRHELVQSLQAHRHMLSSGKRVWPGIFRYECNRLAADPRGSSWALYFYDTEVFWAISQSPAAIERAHLRGQLLGAIA